MVWQTVTPCRWDVRRDGGAQCSLGASTLAVLDCLFAAAEAAPPGRIPEGHATVAAQHSIGPVGPAAATLRSHRAAADGIAHRGHHSPGCKPVVDAGGYISPDLARQQASRAAATSTAAPRTADAKHAARDLNTERRMVEVRLLVTHFLAGLLVGTAAGPGKATTLRVVAIAERRDETAIVVSGCMFAVKQEVVRIVGKPARSSLQLCNYIWAAWHATQPHAAPRRAKPPMARSSV